MTEAPDDRSALALDGLFTFDPEWLGKVEQLRKAGTHPYPTDLRTTHTSADMNAKFAAATEESAWKPASEELGEVALGGRLMAKRDMGKAMFLRVEDRAGHLQWYARKEGVGEDGWRVLKGLDLGDIVWGRGRIMRTRSGELTLEVVEIRLAGKCMSPMPDTWNSVTDIQFRSRQRYVDLFMNEETRDTFRKRSQIVRLIRDFFEERGFCEVETPMMQPIPGGAAARPFVTHHNALDMQLYLRVAPELYLKRLIVGGMERVFEINRNFRNEGVSVKHNPEFTMLEFYQAWATMEDLVTLTQDLFVGLVDEVVGTRKVVFNGMELDFEPPFRRADMDVLIGEKTGLSLDDLADPAKMAVFWREKHPHDHRRPPTHRGGWWEWLFDEYVEKTLVNPTFVTGFPAEISPLSRRSDERPDRCDRFEIVVAGWELANAFSELNDPVDQAERFAAQARQRTEGDGEAMYFDADYIRALTYGMPPTAGQGIGIDRLVMILTGRTSIREVILFPTLRPE